MEMSEINNWIKKEDDYLRSKYSDEDWEKRTYTRTIKLVEEVGELCGEVMAEVGQQRKEKLAERSNSDLAKEFADVMITTLLLANHLKVDVGAALSKKMEIIDQRNSKE